MSVKKIQDYDPPIKEWRIYHQEEKNPHNIVKFKDTTIELYNSDPFHNNPDKLIRGWDHRAAKEVGESLIEAASRIERGLR